MKRYIKSAIQPMSDIDDDFLSELVWHRNTDSDVLDQLVDILLSKSFISVVDEVNLEEIARHANISVSTIQKLIDAALSGTSHLSQSTRDDIIDAILVNKNTPKELLWDFLENDSFYASTILKNPNVDVDFIRRMATLDSKLVHSSIAEDEHTPADILAILASEDYYSTRAGVAKNPNTPTDILEQLLDDEEPTVRIFAERNLGHRK